MLPLDGNIQVPEKCCSPKADLVERSIKQLKAVRDGLRHAANCPEKNHLDCPTFQRLMHAAFGREKFSHLQLQPVRPSQLEYLLWAEQRQLLPATTRHSALLREAT